jgi:hypothetical protein
MKTRIGRQLAVLTLRLFLPALLSAQYVELGSGGTLLMNVPFCGG